MDSGTLSDFHLDVLKEVSNIGAGNAATSLSSLLGRAVDMRVSRVVPMPFNGIVDYAGGAERMILSVFVRIEGGISGNMLFVMGTSDALALISHMTGASGGEGFTDMGLSVIHEVGNIMIGSYITALSDFLGFELTPSVPSLAMDMAGAILAFSLSEIGRSSDTAIVIDGCLSLDGNPLSEEESSHIFLLPDPDSFGRIFQALGVAGHGGR
ncbi:MAG TPA: chemotaxis protein CheC [Aminivibrio sp.]|jgi:chemotaxis protein CheC|uniref:chemotaxis protein CheC n=1 Tax=Aminivibrio sp. TaxID=1872489 RepID=UPI002C970D92|nr:chemotaxis protein CheC [Synergistales bacterium]HRX25649.1 chemotaxis protein CheC [Aminivibrio sp.]